MPAKLQGALRWSAAEDAAVRISVIRDSLLSAASAADGQKQLRHGLHELDNIRSFLQEGINSCNQEFLDNGATDGVLHSALEKGLSELEEVRRKVVSTLSASAARVSAATGAGGATSAAAAAAAASEGGVSSIPLRRQRPPSAPAARLRRDGDVPQPIATNSAANGASSQQLGSTLAGGRANSFSVNGVGGQRAPVLQRSGSAKARPMSATNRPTSATRRTFGDFKAVNGDAPPPPQPSSGGVPTPGQRSSTGGWTDESRGGENTTPGGPPPASTTAKPAMPTRMRPSSAPNRHRSGGATPASGNTSTNASGLNADGKLGDEPRYDANGGAGGNEASAWGKYQDWAQSVLNRVQSRRVQQHRQSLARQRQDGAGTDDAFPATSSAGAAATSAAAAAQQNGTSAGFSGDGAGAASGPSSSTAPTAPARPGGPKIPLAQGPVLRRAQTASINRQPVPGAAGPTTPGTGGAPARPQSAGVRLGAQAQALREQGNIYFQQKKYRESAECYGRALDIEPQSETLFCNRAATYLMMNKFAEALHDSLKAIELDPTHVKAHWRAAKAYLYLGHPDEAKSMYTAAQKLAEGADRDSVSAELRTVDLIEKCRRCLRLREWQEALRCADGILEVFPSTGPCAMPWMCLKAEALLHVDSTEAGNLLTQMCNDEACTSECWFLRAKALFYTGHDAVSTNSCLTYLQRARELDPSNSRVGTLETCINSFAKLRDEGNGAYAAGKWQEAYVAYTKCLSVDAYNNSLKAIILCNRAAVCIQCERWRDALDDINQSIGFNAHNAKAYTRRARIHQHNNNHDAAVKDLQLAVQMYPSAENQERLAQATELRNQAQRQQQRQQQQQQAGAGGAGSFRYFNFASGQGAAGGATGGVFGAGSQPQQQQQSGGTNGAYRPFTAGAKRPQSGGPQRPPPPGSAGPSFGGANAAPQPRQRTHYDTLGVTRNCDERTIVKAYRDAALKWHPDKWAAATDEQKLMAENTFKEVSIAYSTLKDAAKRRQYDLTLVF